MPEFVINCCLKMYKAQLGVSPRLHIEIFFFALLLMTAIAPVSVAEDASTQAVREHEQRLRQEQLRLQDKLRNERPAADVFLQPKDNATEQPIETEQACVNVSLIAVQGVVHLDMTLVDAVTEPYLNRCLTLSHINQLLKDISSLYLNRGYITSRAFIQPQRLQQGTLDILVIEGKLEKLASSEGNLTQRQLRWAFPAVEGKILNLRDLEQGIEQLNRLQQNAAELNIQPGATTGDSIVAIKNTRGRRLNASISLDNSGSEATGEIIAGASIYWDNPLNSNDSFYFTLNDALDGVDKAQSRSYALAYSIPSGYVLFNLNANYFEYQQLVKGLATPFFTSGTASNQSLGLDYTVYRGQYQKLLITAGFSHKLSKNYLEDVFLETSSRSLYIADAGLVYTYKLDRGLMHSSFNWFKSMDISDAKKKLSAAEKSYQFNKYTLDFALNKNFLFLGQQFSYRGTAHYFYSPQNIIASEGLSLGGRYTVRGVEGEGLSGNKGGYIRSEISYSNVVLFGARIEPYTGIDIGAANAPDYEKDTSEVAGAVLGMRYGSRYISADCTYARAVKIPDFLAADRNGIYLSLRFSF